MAFVLLLNRVSASTHANINISKSHRNCIPKFCHLTQPKVYLLTNLSLQLVVACSVTVSEVIGKTDHHEARFDRMHPTKTVISRKVFNIFVSKFSTIILQEITITLAATEFSMSMGPENYCTCVYLFIVRFE